MSKQLVTSFDPTAVASSTFPIQFAGNHDPKTGVYGYLLIANESSVGLIFQIEADQFRLPPWTKDKVVLTAPTTLVTWKEEFTLANAAGAPVAMVYVDGFTWDEKVSDVYPLALMRNTNIGNTVQTAMTATLINDGAAANTQIIETTPAGETQSAFVLDNRGNVTLRTGNNGFWNIVFSIIDGGASPYTALFHGQADTATTALGVAAANVAAGALGSGVTSPNYLPLTGGTVTGQLTLDKAMSGSDVILQQLEASDASPAARWTFVQRHSDSALLIKDQTNGNTPVVLPPTAGSATYAGTLDPQNGNGTFGIRGDFSGTGAGTVATGAGTTPTWLGITDDQSGSTSTVGAVISGTSAIVSNPSGHTWMGIAI